MRAKARLITAALALLIAGCGDDAPAISTAPLASTTTAPVTTTTAAPGPAASATTAAAGTVPTTAPTTVVTAPVPTSSTAVPATTVLETTTSLETTTFRVATPDDPLLIWVIGDSLAWALGYATRDLAEATGAAEVVIDNYGGSGLVRPDYFHWPVFVSERMPEIRPEVVVITIGANDGQAFRTPEADIDVGTPEWIEHYEREVGDFMDLLAYACEHVYWVGPPSMQGERLNERMRLIGDLHAGQAELRPKVTYLDSFALFVDEDGRYAEDLPNASGRVVQMRQEDGVHYTWEGGYHLARIVVAAIAADWGFEDLLGE